MEDFYKCMFLFCLALAVAGMIFAAFAVGCVAVYSFAKFGGLLLALVWS
jgi:hypothetical protein